MKSYRALTKLLQIDQVQSWYWMFTILFTKPIQSSYKAPSQVGFSGCTQNRKQVLYTTFTKFN